MPQQRFYFTSRQQANPNPPDSIKRYPSGAEEHLLIDTAPLVWHEFQVLATPCSSGLYILSKRIQNYIPDRVWGPTKVCFIQSRAQIMGFMFVRGLVKFGAHKRRFGLYLELTGPLFELASLIEGGHVFPGYSTALFPGPETLIRRGDIHEYDVWVSRVCRLWRGVKLGDGDTRCSLSVIDAWEEYHERYLTNEQKCV